MDKIRQTMDSLEEITGVTYDEPLEWRFPGEKGRLTSLDDYLVKILEQKGLKIRICGNCEHFRYLSDECDIWKKKFNFEYRCINLGCEPDYWTFKKIPEIPEEKK